MVIAAVAMVALLAMTGLIIDGGNVWSQQRITQNGSDAASEAGPSSWLAWVAATKTDVDVSNAVSTSATTNGITIQSAYYTEYQGNLLTSAGVVTTNPANAAAVGVVGTIPPNSQGVQANGAKSFSTYLSRNRWDQLLRGVARRPRRWPAG